MGGRAWFLAWILWNGVSLLAGKVCMLFGCCFLLLIFLFMLVWLLIWCVCFGIMVFWIVCWWCFLCFFIFFIWFLSWRNSMMALYWLKRWSINNNFWKYRRRIKFVSWRNYRVVIFIISFRLGNGWRWWFLLYL